MGCLANENPPKLRTHDRYGNRIDEVEFHPAWHRLLARAVGPGLHARPGAAAGHLHAAPPGFYLWSQTEAGHGCPISMTYAAVPALRADPALAAEWEPLLTSRVYDPGVPAAPKAGAARRHGDDGEAGRLRRTGQHHRGPPSGATEYVLTGHKWFTSAPMNDVFLVLAQARAG